MVYVDTTDTSAIATAVRTLVGDTEAQVALAAAGRKRAATFTWQRTADATAEVYRRLAGAR
jgi:glycosyltransferase involved in cell wall biosynthesis